MLAHPDPSVVAVENTAFSGARSARLDTFPVFNDRLAEIMAAESDNLNERSLVFSLLSPGRRSMAKALSCFLCTLP
jgi:hypothetical protein